MKKTEGKVCLLPASSSSSNDGLVYKSPPPGQAPLKAAPESRCKLIAAVHIKDPVSQALELNNQSTDSWSDWRPDSQNAPAKQRKVHFGGHNDTPQAVVQYTPDKPQ
eukprot:8624766-Prorocentrum_lima.AAC.1